VNRRRYVVLKGGALVTEKSDSLIDFRVRLQKLVDQFVNTIAYKNKLVVSEPYYPYDHPNNDEQYPNSGYPGCYVFASGDGNPKYVGKASRCLGNRIWAHVGRMGKPEKDGDLYPNAESWIKQNQPHVGVWTVPIPNEHWWLASALEGFLAESLFPEKSRQI
jgi:hypothetical protein